MTYKDYAMIGASAIFGLTFVLTAGVTRAADNPQQRGEPSITMEQITTQMEEQYNGEVTEVELDREWSGDFYELEIRGQDGYEWDIEVDANTGEVVKEERERDDD